MHVLFDSQRQPFLLNSQMRWEAEPNAFLTWLSVVNGKTSSARTWRSYAYQFADWLDFLRKDRSGLAACHRFNLATYRNIIASESSPQTGRPLKRSTINHKLTVISQSTGSPKRRVGSVRSHLNWKRRDFHTAAQ